MVNNATNKRVSTVRNEILRNETDLVMDEANLVRDELTFVRDEVTMMTSSAIPESSLIPRYTRRRSTVSLA